MDTYETVEMRWFDGKENTQYFSHTCLFFLNKKPFFYFFSSLFILFHPFSIDVLFSFLFFFFYMFSTLVRSHRNEKLPEGQNRGPKNASTNFVVFVPRGDRRTPRPRICPKGRDAKRYGRKPSGKMFQFGEKMWNIYSRYSESRWYQYDTKTMVHHTTNHTGWYLYHLGTTCSCTFPIARRFLNFREAPLGRRLRLWWRWHDQVEGWILAEFANWLGYWFIDTTIVYIYTSTNTVNIYSKASVCKSYLKSSFL